MTLKQVFLKKLRKIILLSVFVCLTCGCIPLFIGTGVLTGYTISNDSAVGNVKEEYRILWDLCLDKLESMDAEILVSNESKGVIKAVIAENSITIKINTINSKTQRLKVSARRLMLPKAQFAQKVFLKIIENLE